MRRPELEPLSPDLVRLLDSERLRPEPPDNMQLRIRERLGRELLDMTALGRSPAAPTGGLQLPPGRASFRRIPLALTLLTAGGIGGAGLHALMRSEGHPTETAPIASPATLAPNPKASSPASAAPVVVDAYPSAGQQQPRLGSPAPAHRSARKALPLPAPPLSPSAGPPQPPLGPDEELAAERALLEQARTALARGKPVDALSLLARHKRTFAQGRLVEEREALVVLSLAANQQTESARRLAAEFRQKYPHSMLLHAIDATLTPKP